MKYTLGFSTAFLLNVFCANDDLASPGNVIAWGKSGLQETTITVKGDSTKSNSKSNETERVVIATKEGVKSPTEIPNVYKGDNSIDIPNSYKEGQDQSVNIPNPGFEQSEHPKVKIVPVPKPAPEFLPDTAK